MGSHRETQIGSQVGDRMKSKLGPIRAPNMYKLGDGAWHCLCEFAAFTIKSILELFLKNRGVEKFGEALFLKNSQTHP